MLGGELCALTDAYDYAFPLLYDLARILNYWFPFILATNYMSLLNLLIHTPIVSTEKRLMIYSTVASLHQAYDHSDITDIGSLRSGDNMGDAFTKPGICEYLEPFLEPDTLHLVTAQWRCVQRRISLLLDRPVHKKKLLRYTLIFLQPLIIFLPLLTSILTHPPPSLCPLSSIRPPSDLCSPLSSSASPSTHLTTPYGSTSSSAT